MALGLGYFTCLRMQQWHVANDNASTKKSKCRPSCRIEVKIFRRLTFPFSLTHALSFSIVLTFCRVKGIIWDPKSWFHCVIQ